MNDIKERKCNGCSTKKPMSAFWKNQTLCIDCCKERQKNRWDSRTPKKRLEQHLKHKYDLKMSELVETLEKQNGNCAICNTKLPDLLVYNNRRRGYAIDHNHRDGIFRGVLCLKCNSLFGMANDDVNILSKAISYLEQRGSYAEADVLPFKIKGKR
jgi:hypothetical protein